MMKLVIISDFSRTSSFSCEHKVSCRQ